MSVIKNEEDLASTLNYFDSFELNPLEKLELAIKDFKIISKALSLGSGNMAPSGLTGGAALAVEDFGQKKKILKNQLMAAMRDWPKTMALNEFLKHRLPEVDESFLDRFAHMVSEYKLRKTELEKAEGKDPESDLLQQLDHKPPKGSKLFRGRHIIPGEVEITQGPFEGSKLRLLHEDKDHIYVEPFRASDQSAVTVNKLNRKLEGSHYKVNKRHEAPDVPSFVDASQHAHPQNTETLAQKHLIHGIDVNSEPIEGKHGATAHSKEAKDVGVAGWFNSAHGKTAYIKPSVDFEQDDLKKDPQNYISTARRGTIFHNLARNVFGLGDHVPTTTTFNHPNTGHEHSASELVPNSGHVRSDDRDHEHNEILKQAGDTGVLDKLAVMDSVLGMADRDSFNYLVSPSNAKVHLIDNEFSLNHKDLHIPSYIHDYHKLKGHPNIGEQAFHPEAAKWVTSLDPFKLSGEMAKQGVPPKVISEAVKRLLSIQSATLSGKQKKNEVLFAHSRFLTGQK